MGVGGGGGGVENLAPRMTQPGKERTAPARWTTADPAKSVKPLKVIFANYRFACCSLCCQPTKRSPSPVCCDRIDDTSYNNTGEKTRMTALNDTLKELRISLGQKDKIKPPCHQVSCIVHPLCSGSGNYGHAGGSEGGLVEENIQSLTFRPQAKKLCGTRTSHRQPAWRRVGRGSRGGWSARSICLPPSTLLCNIFFGVWVVKYLIDH